MLYVCVDVCIYLSRVDTEHTTFTHMSQTLGRYFVWLIPALTQSSPSATWTSLFPPSYSGPASPLLVSTWDVASRLLLSTPGALTCGLMHVGDLPASGKLRRVEVVASVPEPERAALPADASPAMALAQTALCAGLALCVAITFRLPRQFEGASCALAADAVSYAQAFMQHGSQLARYWPARSVLAADAATEALKQVLCDGVPVIKIGGPCSMIDVRCPVFGCHHVLSEHRTCTARCIPHIMCSDEV